jgi:hypothetical protein
VHLQAADGCVVLLSQKPYLGVMVTTKGSGVILAIGPYFNSGHRQIFKNLIEQSDIEVTGIVWAGEILGTTHDEKFVFHRANETSGFAHSLKLSPDQQALLALEGLSLATMATVQSDARLLDLFKDHPGLVFAGNYQAEAFSPQKIHILPNLSFGDENFRHDFGNQMSTALTWVSLLAKLKKLVQTYIKWQNDEVADFSNHSKLEQFLESLDVFMVTPYVDLAKNSEKLIELEALALNAYKTLFKNNAKPVLYQFTVEAINPED